MTPDTIRIQNLRAVTHIGVPDSERSAPQSVSICLRLVPEAGLGDLGDEVTRTVDYYEVSQRVLKLAADRPRKLIETLAEEVAEMLLDEFPLSEVGVEIRKFILPETDYVSVSIDRRRASD